MESCHKSLRLVGKVTFGKTLFRLLIQFTSDDCTSIIIMSLFWDMLHSKLTSSVDIS